MEIKKKNKQMLGQKRKAKKVAKKLKKSVDNPGPIWYSNKALQTGAKDQKTETLRGTTDFRFYDNRDARRAPCKLNNVRQKEHQRRTEVLFTSGNLWKGLRN